MNPLLFRALPYLVLLAALAGSHFWAYQHGGKAERSVWLVNEAKAAALAAKQAKEQQVKSDALTAKLMTQQKTINKLSKEKNDALYKITTGRDCLSARVLGVLNRGASALPETAQLPAGTDTADPAAASATDTDVARWITDAQQQYSQAAAQCNALIELVN